MLVFFMQSFDMIVLGSGPAGQRAAIQAAKSGKRVALVEKRECVGGVCRQHRHHPQQDDARSRAASLRL